MTGFPEIRIYMLTMLFYFMTSSQNQSEKMGFYTEKEIAYIDVFLAGIAFQLNYLVSQFPPPLMKMCPVEHHLCHTSGCVI